MTASPGGRHDPGAEHGRGHGGRRGGPTVPAMVLGQRLHRLRQAAGISAFDAAALAGVEPAAVSALEAGQDLLDTSGMHRAICLAIQYGASHAERLDMIEFWRLTLSPVWWPGDPDLLPDWATTSAGLETGAVLIRTYQPGQIPDLLQTPDYARAPLTRPGPHPGWRADRDTEQQIEVRLRRQQILTRARPPLVWAVIDEAALVSAPGPNPGPGGTAPGVMAAQVRHLIGLCELPHIRVQILPRRNTAPPWNATTITLLRPPQDALPDIIVTGARGTGHFIQPPPDERFRYRHLLDTLAIAAHPLNSTPAILRDIRIESR